MKTGSQPFRLAAGPALALAAFSLAAASPSAQAQQALPALPHIPTLQGSVLTGAAVDLPASLTGRRAVLVLGFSQSSRDEVAAWGRRLAGDYRDSPAVTYYEMPVIAAVPKLLRGWVAKKVTEGVPDRAKSHCVLITEHEAAWKAAAGFTHDEDAYILLVDASGTVLWRTEGTPDDTHYADLKRHLEP